MGKVSVLGSEGSNQKRSVGMLIPLEKTEETLQILSVLLWGEAS
jgi:hypothetical protein